MKSFSLLCLALCAISAQATDSSIKDAVKYLKEKVESEPKNMRIFTAMTMNQLSMFCTTNREPIQKSYKRIASQIYSGDATCVTDQLRAIRSSENKFLQKDNDIKDAFYVRFSDLLELYAGRVNDATEASNIDCDVDDCDINEILEHIQLLHEHDCFDELVNDIYTRMTTTFMAQRDEVDELEAKIRAC